MVEKLEVSPRYPFIPLSKAIERAHQLWDSIHDHSALPTDVVKIWGYSEKASGGMQTVAALRYYGLLVNSVTGNVRKLKFSERARNYFRDERPEKHAEAHKEFALAPKAMSMLWGLWKYAPPAEAIARSTLKVDYGYSENNARELLAIYVDNVQFAGLDNPDKIPPHVAPLGEGEEEFSMENNMVEASGSPGATPPTSQKLPQTYRFGANSFHDQPPLGVRREVITLDEGDVVINFPENLSPESFGDLRDHLELFIKKMQRRAKNVQASASDERPTSEINPDWGKFS